MSRFWTQYEAWLSMMDISEDGLVAAAATDGRCTIKAIHDAPSALVVALQQEWKDSTPERTHEKLSHPDVSVTNMRDKQLQV